MPTSPSAATRPDFFAAAARPFFRSQSTASSSTPAVSVSACLQSNIPAPVLSRNCLTNAAVISAIAPSHINVTIRSLPVVAKLVACGSSSGGALSCRSSPRRSLPPQSLPRDRYHALVAGAHTARPVAAAPLRGRPNPTARYPAAHARRRHAGGQACAASTAASTSANAPAGSDSAAPMSWPDAAISALIPSSTAPATRSQYSVMARIASSLPGIG